MNEPESAGVVLGRAGRRAAGHLIEAVIEGMKAVGAIMEEIGRIGSDARHHGGDRRQQKIDIE